MDKHYSDGSPAPATPDQRAIVACHFTKQPATLSKKEILETLRRKRHDLPDEDAAWASITAAAAERLDSSSEVSPLVYQLGLIYARHTGAMPGYTNSDNQTHFERFAGAVLARVAPRVTQNQLRAMIRKLDAKNNGRFQDDLKLEMAAE